MKYIYIYIYCLSLFASLANAQILDTIILPEVTLVENKLSFENTGSKIKNFNHLRNLVFPSDNIGDFLQFNSSFYIKKYGALATSSFRGTSSSHTLILWEGIPLNSLSTGVFDFNLINSYSFDNLSIVKGGLSSLFGSGALGATLYLKEDLNFIKKQIFTYSLDVNNSGLNSNNISLNYSNDYFASSIYFRSTTDKNNFLFVNTSRPNNPIDTNSHALILSKEFKSNFAYKLNKKNFLNSSLWISKYDREIPVLMTNSFSNAKQYDDSYRYLINYSHKNSFVVFNFKNSLIIEDFVYTDTDLYSSYINKSFYSRLNVYKSLAKSTFELEFTFNNNYVNSSSLISQNITENNFFSFIKYKYLNKKLTINSCLRHELRKDLKVPIIPSLSAIYKLNKFNFSFLINRNFRVPTFNDKYWASSGSLGNVNLLSEESINYEFSISRSRNKLNYDLTFFSQNVDNWITWLPLQNGIWMPENIKNVWSRGLELNSYMSINKLLFNLNYSFTKTTNQTPINNLDNSFGKQLRYVPLNKCNFSIKYQMKDFELIYSVLYNGQVYTVSDQSNFLDDYLLNNFLIKYLKPKARFEYSLKVINLFNNSYQSYENYPNPRREILLNIQFKLTKQ